MRYLVVLDAESPIGRVYAAGNCEGFVGEGETREIRHPVLDCADINTESPCYLFVKRDPRQSNGPRQQVYVPHGCVVAIHVYDDSGPKPLGFVPVG